MGGMSSYDYDSFLNAVNQAFAPVAVTDSDGDEIKTYNRETGRFETMYTDSPAKRQYGTKAAYAEELDKQRLKAYEDDRYDSPWGDRKEKIDRGEYFNSATDGMDRDAKVNAYLNGYTAVENFNFDDGSSFSRQMGDKQRLTSKGARYQLQEYLGETVEGYVKRRNDSARRDALRKQMLKEKDIIDGGKSKQQTTEGGLG